MKQLSKIILLLCIVPIILGAQSKNIVTITVKENESIRDIAEKYLQDPDVWEAILKYNNLSKPSDAKPGAKLKIPIGDYKKAKESIRKAITSINKASDTGAKIFAEQTLSKATKNYSKALEQNRSGRFKASAETANTALKFAEAAYDEARSKRSVKSAATLTDKQGKVEDLTPVRSTWNNTPMPGKLNEGDRIRTLSSSFAEITFDDGNRIKLNSNAQALIQTMRVDLLEKKKQSSVQIVEGDAFAYLTGSSGKKQFNVDIPGIKTNLKSKNFWVKKSKKKTNIANYDGQIEVSSGGSTITLKENEKSTIVGNGKPSAAKRILFPAELIAPIESATIIASDVVFSWKKVNKAQSYWLEVSSDRNFKRVVLFKKNIKKETFAYNSLQNGIYYWRLAAIDDEGVPGQRSSTEMFIVSPSAEAPYLVINSPLDAMITSEKTITIEGKTEAGIKLSVNGTEITPADDGHFSAPFNLAAGNNVITIKAQSETGASNEIVRKVFLDTPEDLKIDFDKEIKRQSNENFLFNSEKFTIKGTVRPNSLVELQNRSGKKYRTYSSDKGAFEFNVLQTKANETYSIGFKTISGFAFEDTLSVVVDSEAPVITLDSEPPTSTRKPVITISGNVNEKCELFINDFTTNLSGMSFNGKVSLIAGENTITIRAVDEAGNESVMKAEIMLDRDAPLLKQSNITKETISGVSALRISIIVEEATSLKNTCQLKVLYGNKVEHTFIKLNKANGKYEGLVYKPSSKYPPQLISVILEDYLGNRKEYRINQ